MKCLILAAGFGSLILGAPMAPAATVTPQEMSEARGWVAAHLGRTADGKAPTPPFSFIYGGRPSAELLKDWKYEQTSKALDPQRTEHTLLWTDPATGLSVRCRAVEYLDFPTVEWTLHLKNTGGADTPILENIQPLELRLLRANQGEFTLHHNVGSPAAPNDYQPLQTVLGPKASKRFAGAAGKPTGSDWSYFNLEWPGQGVIVVVGWPGQWAAQFTRDAANGLDIRAGQELTHFKLLPGEEVRTPLIVLQFWKGDWIRAQNIWRRWMLAHNVPRPGGKLPEPELFGCSSHLYRGDDRGQRREPDEVHRPLPGGRDQDRPLVDGRRLVSQLRQRLAADRHLGSRYEALPARVAGHQRLRPFQGHQDHRLVRARAGGAGNLAHRKTIPTGSWAAQTAAC